MHTGTTRFRKVFIDVRNHAQYKGYGSVRFYLAHSCQRYQMFCLNMIYRSLLIRLVVPVLKKKQEEAYTKARPASKERFDQMVLTDTLTNNV